MEVALAAPAALVVFSGGTAFNSVPGEKGGGNRKRQREAAGECGVVACVSAQEGERGAYGGHGGAGTWCYDERCVYCSMFQWSM